MTDATSLPPGLTCYSTSPLFTNDTVPPKLLASHDVKAGVWGLLRVVRGRLRYHIDREPPSSQTVEAGGTAVIEPQVPHHVELLHDDTAFVIEFHRAAAAGA